MVDQIPPLRLAAPALAVRFKPTAEKVGSQQETVPEEVAGLPVLSLAMVVRVAAMLQIRYLPGEGALVATMEAFTKPTDQVVGVPFLLVILMARVALMRQGFSQK